MRKQTLPCNETASPSHLSKGIKGDAIIDAMPLASARFHIVLFSGVILTH